MRIFVAGASGVVGRHLVPLLVADGHHVAAMTRSPWKTGVLREMGALPVLCDVFEADELAEVVMAFAPDTVLHEVTDLPDDPALVAEHSGSNARIRRVGTRNLLDASKAAGAERFLAQSVAWRLSGEDGAAVEEMEEMVLGAGGVVLRYGRLYGPGTYHENDLPPPPRVSILEAARRTASALDAPSSILTVVDGGPRCPPRSAAR